MLKAELDRIRERISDPNFLENKGLSNEVAVYKRQVLEDPAHVIEQLGDRQHCRGRAEMVSLLQKELSILIFLDRGTAKPHHRLGLIFGTALTH